MDDLNVSSYTVFVNYLGTINYTSINETKEFTVSKANSNVNYDITSYSYNNTKNVTITVNDQSSNVLAGKVLVNLTDTIAGEVISSTQLDIADVDGQVTGNIFELPVLDAGTYSVSTYYEGNNNYQPSSNTKTFTVAKAQPVIEITPVMLTDANVEINVHVIPELATGQVSLTATSDDNTFGVYTLDLDNSRASKVLYNLPRGEYKAIVTYSVTDKNHEYGVGESSFSVIVDDYPIDVTAKDITYGESQLINITVPADTIEDNLVIKLNDEVLDYTIDNGFIQINTGILTVGEYILSVDYDSQQHYRSNSTNKTFNVNKKDATINLTANDISYLSNQTITISSTDYNLTGK